MILSKRNKFIFIHNAKAAGTSVTDALSEQGTGLMGKILPESIIGKSTRHRIKRILGITSNINKSSPSHDMHITAKQLREDLGDEEFDSYYSFGFVRNPWDLVVSLYKYILQDPTRPHYDVVKEMQNFDEFVSYWCQRVLAGEERIQKEYFYDGDEKLVNYVGRFENLNDDFIKICAAINLDKTLERKNPSRKKEDSFLNYYSESSADLVEAAYRIDLKLFGYVRPTFTP